MKQLLTLISLLISLNLFAQTDLSYYLPANVEYDANIPTPKSIIGHEVGEWHVSHDKLVQYMYALAEASDRISIREYARTYENRPLVVLTVTSSNNLGNIENIRTEHLKLSDPNNSSSVDINNIPAVLYMGYSVHGNEASGSNASMVAAYHLAAAQGNEINQVLENTVILLDPSYNPDGLNRFASWVNTHKSKNLVSDPNSIELNEAWPRGRTNHYWFDLNRDWLPVQLPESRGRIKTFHDWKPNVLTDHHEMGTNSTYFFQPGIPSRNHPLTPKKNYILTEKIAQYHAKGLDGIGSMYYSKESFDDFYYGKGSTFPDANGGVGILFEQASSRGHAQQSANGVVTFPFAIRNHFTTTLSTIKAVNDLRIDLLTYQKDFYKNSISAAAKDPVKAYVFGEETDKTRTNELVKIFQQHRIGIYQNKQNISKSGYSFTAKDTYIVPLNQPQYTLIKAIFNKRITFKDSLFYDVSAWTLPLAFNIKYAELGSKSYNSSMLGDEIIETQIITGKVIGDKSNVAYVFEWDDYNAPLALNKFQSMGLLTKVAMEPFSSKDKQFSRGSIIIPATQSSKSVDQVFAIANKVAKEAGISVYSLKTGYTSGINLGSPNIVALSKPKAMMLIEGGVTSYDAGEVWHLLDQRVGYPLSQVSIEKFKSINIDKYNTIIMVNGNYNGLHKEKLKKWVLKGGTIIAMKRGAQWLSKNEISKVKFKKNKPDTTRQLPYNYRYKYRGAQVIGGSIFEAKLDTTHPIGFGFNREKMSIFRNSTLFMNKIKDPYSNPLVYTNSPLLSGYISKENIQKLKGTSAINISKLGKGKIISFSDNPNFRAFWYGTNKLFLNAMFFGGVIR